jgi:hypothetical protein
VSDSAVVALFLVVALITGLESLLGLRLALNPRPPERPAWLGWLMFVSGVGLCVFAIVLALTR